MKSIFKSKKVWISIIVVLLVVIGVITAVTVSGSSNTKAVLKQLSLGEKYLSELDYEKAVVAYNKVIEIEPRNLQAYLGLAEAYEGLDQTEDAIAALETATSIVKEDKSSNGEVPVGSENIYIKLAGLYENSGDTENAYRTLQEGFELIGSAKIKELLAKYNPKVEASVLSGNYETAQMVTLVSDATTIYYTMEGSEPTKESEVYKEPLIISEGNITLQAVAENGYGELGEIYTYSYSIEKAEQTIELTSSVTPVPTAIPVPTVTPEPTATPKPTDTPKSTKPPTPTPSPEATPPSRSIPEGANEYQRNYYYVYTQKVSRENAETYCESVGGHLVAITSAEEQEFINSIIDSKEYWIGGYRSSDTWNWVTGEKWGYTNWSTIATTTYRYICIFEKHWFSVNEYSYGYICEWEDKSDSDYIGVPNVVGLRQLEAIEILKRCGLSYQVWWYTDDLIGGQDSFVVNQSVAPDTSVIKGTVIKLQLSDYEYVAVPNVIGMKQLEATEFLKNNDLSFQVYWLPEDVCAEEDPFIVEQSVEENSMVKKGTVIRLRLSSIMP